jgi:hypothetical protein
MSATASIVISKKKHIIMEEKQMTEKESIELISQMIQSTKRNMEVGSGNHFLYWGYFTLALSVAIYFLSGIIQNAVCQWMWCLMFLFWAFMSYRTKKIKKPKVKTYTDSVIDKVWQVMGAMFILTFIAVFICTKLFNYSSIMVLMMPLSILYVGIGVSISGIIIRERWVIYMPVVSFIIAFVMLAVQASRLWPILEWDLLMGISFIFSMIIPGHVLNYKARRQC